MSIEVIGLMKAYGAQQAVNDISFTVEKGQIVGFLGPNGAGKSTTMKIITGYLKQDGGQALVCGISVKDHPLQAKKQVGYLPESNPLYYEMYVREYLDFIAGIHKVHDKKKRIEDVIGITGLQHESHKKAGQLSKGYRQRVGLAAALIHDPEVLILDEPTSGLDPNQIIEIREVIRQYGKSKTVLFSSHILQEVEAICDRVIIISKGRLVADDKLSTLQQANGENHIVSIKFREPVPKGLLENLQDANKVDMLPDFLFSIQTSNPELLRKQLFELSLLHNLNIVSLQTDSHSLEDVFRSLTTDAVKNI